MRIRGYLPGDLDAMCRLDAECFAGAFQFDCETMREAVEAPSAIIVIADDDAAEDPLEFELLGFVIVHSQGSGRNRYAYVITIDVAHRARRSGVGASILRQAEAQSRGAGQHHIALHVSVDNQGAIAFYERESYQRTGLAKGFYHQAGCDALIYAKHL